MDHLPNIVSLKSDDAISSTDRPIVRLFGDKTGQRNDFIKYPHPHPTCEFIFLTPLCEEDVTREMKNMDGVESLFNSLRSSDAYMRQ